MMRKPLACLVVLSLLLTSMGGPQCAQAVEAVVAAPKSEQAAATPAPQAVPVDLGEIDPAAALKFFETNGVFKDAADKPDVLRSHMVDESGQLSPMGKIYYRYLMEGTDQKKPEGKAPESAEAAKKEGEIPAGPAGLPSPEVITSRIKDFSGAFDSLRKLGKATPEMRSAATARMQKINEDYFKSNFRDLTVKIRKERSDTFDLRSLLQAGFDGAAGAHKPKQEYVQVDTPNGYVFLDDKGEAVRLNKNMVCRHSSMGDSTEPLVMSMVRFKAFKADQTARGEFGSWSCGEGGGVTIFNRALRDQQEAMNDPKNKPACAPEIPLTGRYSYEMLKYSECRLEEQVKQLEAAMIADRLSNMAQMLGEQYAGDQMVKDGRYNRKLQTALEERAAKESLEKFTEKDRLCPGVKNVLEYTNCKYEKTKKNLDEAKAALAKYKARVAGFQDRQIITDGDIQSLQTNEKQLSVGVSKTFLNIQTNQALSQLEVISYEVDAGKVNASGRKDGVALDGSGKKGGSWLTEWDWKKPGLPEFMGGQGLSPFKWKDYESPDSKYLRENLEGTGWDEAQKEKYLQRRKELALRLGRLTVVYAELEKELDIADPETGLAPIQSMLQATQKELGSVGLDLSMYVSLPALAKVAKDETESWNYSKTLVLAGHKAANWFSNTFWDGSAGKEYIEHRALIDTYKPAFVQMAGLIADGNYEGARKAMVALNPDAVTGSWSVPVFGDGDPEITDPMKVQAAMARIQKSISYIAERHMVADTAANMVIWSVALGVAAPVVSVVAGGVGRSMLALGGGAVKVGGKAAIIARPIGYLARGIGAILEHSAIRLNSLSPASDKIYSSWRAARYAEAVGVRTVNAFGRLAGFTTLAGGISAGFGGAMYQYNAYFGDGNNPNPDVWSAAILSGKHGAKWAMDDWHPMLLFAGLPSNAFDGLRGVSGAANSIAHRGVMGNLGAAGRNVGGATSNVIRMSARGEAMMNSIARWRGAAAGAPGIKQAMALGGKILSNPVVVMADHVAKFIVISQGAGKAARYMSYEFNTVDETNIERRIKRAEQAKAHHMEAPWWLLLPVAAAKTEMAALSHQRTQQGVKEYLDAGEGHRLTEMVPEVSELALKTKPKVPLMQKFFNLSWRGEKGESGMFKITKELHQEVIQKVLPGEIRGVSGGKIVPPTQDILGRLYEISQGNVKRVGRLKVTDIVIDQAGELFVKQVGKSTQLRAEILGIKPEALGKTVKGYGVVDLKVQKEFARSVWRNRNETQYKVSSAEIKLAEQILQAELKTELAVENAALDALNALKASKTPSPEFKKLIESTLEDITAWKDHDANLLKRHGEDYMSLIREMQSKASGLKSPAEKLVVNKTADYLTSIRERFNHFNKVGDATVRAEMNLQSRVNQLEAGKYGQDVPRMLQRMQSELKLWRAQQANADAPVGKGFDVMVDKLSKEVQALKGKLSDSDYLFLQRSMKEFESSPWILRDSKGTNLRDWRPEQVEGLMYFMGSMMTKGSDAAQTVRTFLMMKTGAGKTFLAYEGLLPFAEAVASGKAGPKLKTVFLTVQSNLESQARIEFRAMNKLRTGLEFDTWEGFKSKIAQGKLDFGMKAEDYFILGDEMDGAALQPALTIGETTATVSRWSVGYQKLKPSVLRMREVVNRGSVKLKAELEGIGHRQRSYADTLPDGPAKDALVRSSREILSHAQKLAQLDKKFFVPRTQRAEVLAQARGVLKNLSQRGRATGRGPAIPDVRFKAKVQALEEQITIQREIAKDPAARAQAKIEIARLTRALKDLKVQHAQGKSLSVLVEPRLGEQIQSTIETLSADAAKLAAGGKTKQAATMRAKVENLKQLFKAMQSLERLQTPSALRRQAQGLRERADILSQSKGTGRDAAKLRKTADRLDSEATAAEKNPTLLENAIAEVNAKLRELYSLDIAFERTATTRQMRQVLEGQKEHLKDADAETVKDFESSGKELQKLLDNQESIARVDRGRALELQRDLMLQEKAVLAASKPAGAKLVKRLQQMARQARADKNSAAAERIDAQAKKVAAEGASARKALRTNSQEIESIISDGKKGWESKVREKLNERDALVEKALDKESPIYELFREMRDAMYPHVHSAQRVIQEFQTLEHAPRSARESLLRNGSNTRKSAKALVAKLKALEAQGKPVKGRLKQAETLLKKVNENAEALYKERRALKDYEHKAQKGEHEALFKAGKEQETIVEAAETTFQEAQRDLQRSSSDSKLKSRVEAAEKEFNTANEKLKSINESMAKFNQGRKARLEAKLEQFETQAKGFARDVEIELAKLTKDMQNSAGIQPEVDALLRDVQSSSRRWGSERSRLKMTPEIAEQILSRRIDGVSTPKILGAYALELPRQALVNAHKVPLLGRLPGVKQFSNWVGSKWKGVEAKEGLSRNFARRLLWEFLSDPLITPAVRWRMFWTLLPSTVFSRGTVVTGPSWVQSELYNLARGYVEPARTIRFDHGTGKVNVVHNGQWFESMDTPTRRFWELEYGSDLTLPYDSQTIATIKDVTTNTKVKFVGFSGTAGKEFRARLTPYKIELTGVGSKGADHLDMEIHSSASGKMKSITTGLKRNMLHDFQQVEAGGQSDSLLVLSLADTRAVKLVQKVLTERGVSFSRSEVTPKALKSLMEQGFDVQPTAEGYNVRLQKGHLAKVFSDAELLRTQMPNSNVEAQMNLEGLTPGKVKVLLLDTRVGGRGLDLNFKGQRGQGPFTGYNHFEMQLHDPQVASEAHFLQAQGRIDVGRVNKGATRTFRMVMDVPASSKEVVFLRMLRDEPLMAQLRQRPEVVKLANQRGQINPEWVDIHQYIESITAKTQAAEAMGQVDAQVQAYQKMIKNYEGMVRRNLNAQKLEVEKDQLRSSSVLQDQAMFNWLNRALYPTPIK